MSEPIDQPGRLKSIANKVKNKLNEKAVPKKGTKSRVKKDNKPTNNAILGICQLLVVVSITYSTAVILIGVDSVESRIALVPQVVFALAILIKAFSKLYK